MTDQDRFDFSFPDPWGDLPGYALNALNPDEMSRVEALLESSAEARDELRSYMEAAENLSLMAADAEPSDHVRMLLLAQADRDIHLIEVARQEAHLMRPRRSLRSRMAGAVLRPASIAYAGTAAAVFAVIAIAVIFGMENSRLDSEIGTLRSDVQVELAQVAELRSLVEGTNAQFASRDAEVARLTAVNAALNEALQNQQWLTYVTQNREFRVPNYFVGSPEAPEASGTLAIKNFDDQAVFLVSGLPPAPVKYQYVLSLIRDGVPEPVATSQVNEAGMAKVDFELPNGIAQYESAVVSLEMAPNEFDGDVATLAGTEFMTASETP